MPFLALAGPIAGALGASAGTAGLIGAAGSVAGGLLANSQAKKVAGQAANASQVDIDALDAKTREIAKKNALQSAELERQLTPEVPQLRTAANQGVMAGLAPSASDQAAESFLLQSLGHPAASQLNTPLLRAAIAKAHSDLALGGELPLDVRNMVARRAASTAGTVAPGGLGLGRDITARDLGLTSLDLSNQRLQNASQLGGQELALEGENANLGFNNAAHALNIVQLLQQLSGARFGRNLAAAQYGESIQRPVVGLDPGSVADVTIGNSNNRGAALANQANIAGQSSQNLFNFGGQMLGYGLLNGFGGTATQAPKPYSGVMSKTGPSYASSIFPLSYGR